MMLTGQRDFSTQKELTRGFSPKYRRGDSPLSYFMRAVMSVLAQRGERLQASGTPRRKQSSQQGADDQDGTGETNRNRIVRLDAEEELFE